MASLSIRRLDDLVYNQLQTRAVAHGVSMEEEVRGIITQAVLPPKKISEIFREHFGPGKGVNLELPVREVNPPLDLSAL